MNASECEPIVAVLAQPNWQFDCIVISLHFNYVPSTAYPSTASFSKSLTDCTVFALTRHSHCTHELRLNASLPLLLIYGCFHLFQSLVVISSGWCSCCRRHNRTDYTKDTNVCSALDDRNFVKQIKRNTEINNSTRIHIHTYTYAVRN